MSPPQFSVVIPTYNRPAPLECCLEALALSQCSPHDFEVIVVDDGSAVPPDRIIAGVAARMDVRLIRQTNGGPAKARNRGVEAARYPFLAFTDDDCRPRPGWLPALQRRAIWSPECLVGGKIVNGLAANPYSSASQFISDMVYAYYNADSTRSQFFSTNNMSVRADLFRASGGFDETFRVSEDREFCNRWAHGGLGLLFESGAVVEHYHQLNFVDFCRQHYGYGRGAARYHRVCSWRKSGDLQDHFGFYWGIGRWWREAPENRRHHSAIRMVSLLAVWQMANLAGYVRERAG